MKVVHSHLAPNSFRFCIDYGLAGESGIEGVAKILGRSLPLFFGGAEIKIIDASLIDGITVASEECSKYSLFSTRFSHVCFYLGWQRHPSH